MHVQRDSFFRIFSSELRGALQYFFENRRARITPEIASEIVDLVTLERLVAMGLIELITLRRQVIQKCNQVGDGLIDIYQRTEEYLNRVQRDYARARKLLQLCSLIERHEHLTATNVRTVAELATGPWFHEMRLRTLLDPRIGWTCQPR